MPLSLIERLKATKRLKRRVLGIRVDDQPVEDEDCILTADFTHLTRDSFCPWCHNLSLNDHRPVPAGGDESGYYKSLEDPKSRRFAVYMVNVENIRKAYGGFDTIACRYCSIMIELLRYSYSLVDEVGSRELPLADLPHVAVVLLAGGRCQITVVHTNLWVQAFELALEGGSSPHSDLSVPSPGPPQICGPESLEFIRERLDDCQMHHTDICTLPGEKLWPARLLAISRHNGRRALHLVETQALSGGVDYVALSHCWGKNQPVKLTTSNFDAFQRAIKYKALPVVFKNVIEVCESLQISYLWIDSLCIIQDDREDWARESVNMGAIFEHSLLTIAAVRSENSSAPFVGPQVKNDLSYLRFLVQEPQSGDIVSLVARTITTHEDDSSRPPMEGPLSQRAWTYQEMALSSRIVGFTSRGVTWSCNKMSAREGFQRELILDGEADSTIPPLGAFSWQRHVTEYTGRDLTFFSDRLPAISGFVSWLVKREKREDWVYLAGLWLQSLERHLAWRVQKPLQACNVAPSAEYPDYATAPSWSWASVQAKVMWLYHKPEDLEGTSRIKIVRYHVEPASSNAYGSVKAGGFLELEGLCVSVLVSCRKLERRWAYGNDGPTKGCWIRIPHDENSSWDICHDSRLRVYHHNGLKSGQICRATTTDQCEEFSDAPATCLLLYESTKESAALLLSESPTVSGSFQRIGIAYFPVGRPVTASYTAKFAAERPRVVRII